MRLIATVSIFLLLLRKFGAKFGGNSGDTILNFSKEFVVSYL